MIQAQKEYLCGSVISDRYQIIESLGQRDMAHVYLAIDQETGEKVAIEFMLDDLSNDPVYLKRFEAEASAVSCLNHPNIVRVIGFGQDHEHGYIVHEYVEGCSLKKLINKTGAIPWQTAALLAIQIGLALEHVCKNGLVHGDIKPQNILITQERLAKVTGFCIAKAVTANMVTLTSGMPLGSVHYASPERARGSTMSDKSDIYSLGILIYEMVTGRVPFDGDNPVAIAIKYLQGNPPPPSLFNHAVPHGLDQIIMKCIQKSPDNRYQHARELVDELDALLIDPDSACGVVAGLPDRAVETTALRVMSPEPRYSKLREIEQTIIVRRHLRYRDTAIVMAIVLATIVFVTSIGAWGWSKLSDSIQTEPGQSYELSNYIGRELTEVLAALKKDKIKINIIYSENPTVIVGLVTAQTPGSGAMINKTNATVTLTVSSGPDLLVIPDLSGLPSAVAQTELTQVLGCKVTVLAENAQIDQDMVIRTIPAAGQKAPRGGSIILVVSSGLPFVTMPNFVGKSLSNTRLQMMDLKLNLGSLVSIAGVVTESKRIVISQNIPAGSKIIEQTVISFTYGTALDYANFLNPTPSPAPFILMPGLNRMSLASMNTILTFYGLTNISLSYLSADSSRLPESQLYVINQFPAAGTPILLTDSVQIQAGSLAEYDALKNPLPTPLPTPTPPLTPMPTPLPTPTPPLTPTPTPLPTPTPPLTPTPTPLPTPTPPPTPTPTPLPTPTPTPTPLPTPTSTTEPAATATPTTEPAATATPSPTST